MIRKRISLKNLIKRLAISNSVCAYVFFILPLRLWINNLEYLKYFQILIGFNQWSESI